MKVGGWFMRLRRGHGQADEETARAIARQDVGQARRLIAAAQFRATHAGRRDLVVSDFDEPVHAGNGAERLAAAALFESYKKPPGYPALGSQVYGWINGRLIYAAERPPPKLEVVS